MCQFDPVERTIGKRVSIIYVSHESLYKHHYKFAKDITHTKLNGTVIDITEGAIHILSDNRCYEIVSLHQICEMRELTKFSVSDCDDSSLDIKPCIMCASENVIYKSVEFHNAFKDVIKCTDCGFIIGGFSTKESLIHAWNNP